MTTEDFAQIALLLQQNLYLAALPQGHGPYKSGSKDDIWILGMSVR